MRKRISFFFFSFCLLGVLRVFPQVGINTEEPRTNAVLDIQLSTDEESSPIPQGIYMPSVTTEQRDQILIPTDDASANGLVVYNVDEGCINYYKKGSGWRSLCAEEKSELTYLDQSAVVYGDYIKQTPLNPTSEYITIGANVVTPGPYNVTAKGMRYESAGATPIDNGYYYSASGIVSAAGETILSIPGGGNPREYTADTGYPVDSIVIQMSGNYFATVANRVENNLIDPIFTISDARFVGSLSKGTATTSADYIEVRISGAPIANTPWHIETDEVNGLKFSGSGTIGTNGGIIRLYAETGKNTPMAAGTFSFIVSSNSTTSTITLPVDVRVIARTIKIYGLGSSGYRLNDSSARNDIRAMFTSTSTIPTEGIEFNGSASDVAAATSWADIIVIGYSFSYNSTGSNNRALLQNFINNGGTVIMCTEDGRQGSFLTDVFGENGSHTDNLGSNNPATAITPDAVNLPIATQIVDGPYGRVTTIPVDGGWNSVFNQLSGGTALSGPTYEVVAFRNVSSVNRPRAIIHKTKGAFVILDGGTFQTSLVRGNNKILFCNLLAWAIQRMP